MNQDTRMGHTDVIVHYGSKEKLYAEKFIGICSILNNQSDAADFNKGIRVNKFDEVATKNNEPQYSNRQYEIYIGEDKNMISLDSVFNSFGMHINMTGRKACFFVDSTHTEQEEYKRFLLFASPLKKQFKERRERRSSEGLVRYSGELRETINLTIYDDYFDLPKYIRLIGGKIKYGFLFVLRKLGIARQKDIHKEKFEFLVDFFYCSYFPAFIKEK